MNNLLFFLNWHGHLKVLRLAAIVLVAVAWSSPSFCQGIHNAARDGNLEKVRALIKRNLLNFKQG